MQGFQTLNSSLQQISLDFSGEPALRSPKITDDGLNCLGQGLEKLSSLQKISYKRYIRFIAISSSSCHTITDVGLGHLMRGLQALPSLKHLDLNFHKYFNSHSSPNSSQM